MLYQTGSGVRCTSVLHLGIHGPFRWSGAHHGPAKAIWAQHPQERVYMDALGRTPANSCDADTWRVVCSPQIPLRVARGRLAGQVHSVALSQRNLGPAASGLCFRGCAEGEALQALGRQALGRTRLVAKQHDGPLHTGSTSALVPDAQHVGYSATHMHTRPAMRLDGA